MITYVIPCLLGLEKLVSDEVRRLGLSDVQAENGRVLCQGAWADCARLNVNLRCGARVIAVLARFPARSFEELFQGTKAVAWEEYLPLDAAFPVKGYSINSQLHAVPACQSIIKKAMATRLGEAYGLSYMPETGIKYQIEFFILKDRASLMIDTSGVALHKRGYRPQNAPAPLRETLAAAMVKMARPREDVLFWDPFCGSGTIPIEAAMLMTNTAPGLKRSFAAEDFPFIGKDVWESARKEARDAINTETKFEAYASDCDYSAVKLAATCAKQAGMEKYIKVFEKNALDIKADGRRGTIVCNPPYGERLSTIAESEKLYRDMGKSFARLGSWQIYVITSNESFERLYGRRADKKRKLYNGMIPCGFYQFFRNEKKDYTREKKDFTK